ncbi:hypothetical protein M3Y98_00090900 [Aphelenchoides besseyi]|nr:hypothetical protein M3Y98_00090900 [Aphelenchoides besseyi]KAI6198510.1 hypothetical protein M3Y96_00526600 [Aphelenchoides besseyi]
MFGFARSIGCSLVFVLWVVNFDGLLGNIDVKEKGKVFLKYDNPPVKVTVNPGNPVDKRATLKVGECTLNMDFKNSSEGMHTNINGKPETFKQNFILEVFNDKVNIAQASDPAVKLSVPCSLKATDRSGKKYVQFSLEGDLPTGFTATIEKVEKVDQIPTTTIAPTTIKAPTEPPEEELDEELVTVDAGNSTTPHNKGAEVVSSMGFGSMAVFVLLAVRVF